MEQEVVDQIPTLTRSSIGSPMALESPQLNELFTALSKAQGEYRIAGTRSENPYFKSRYADLAEVIEAARPALAKYGLSLVQRTIEEDGGLYLHSTLGHSSGQYITSKVRIAPSKNDPQSLGSLLTYYKRYFGAALLGVVTSDEDDDAEYAMAEVRDEKHKGTGINTKYNPKNQSRETITKEQLHELERELAEYSDITEMVLSGLKIHYLSDMPKDKFSVSIDRIREIKAARNGLKR